MAKNSSNAVANRYSTEQNDNQFSANFDKDIWSTKLKENQELQRMALDEQSLANKLNFGQTKDYNDYNMRNAEDENSFNFNKTKLQLEADKAYNDTLKVPYEEQYRKAMFDAQQNNNLWNRYYQWWSDADPLKDIDKMQDIASKAKQREDSGSGGVLSALGGIGGSILGSFAGGVGSVAGKAVGSALGDKLGSWIK